jgi:sugar phosphate isomerase/epimerase
MFNTSISKPDSSSRRRFLETTCSLAVATALGQPDPALALTEQSPAGDANKESSFPLRIGVLSGTFNRPTIEAAFDAVKSCGLDCVQLSLASAGLSPQPEPFPQGVLDRIKDAAAARKIAIVAMDGTFNMSHPDLEHRATGLRQLRVLAAACQQLGVSFVHICTGTRDRNSMWRRHSENDSPEAWRDMTGCIREAVNVAQQAGLVLAFEPEVNNVVDSAVKARRLLDEIHSPHLKVTMDGANIFHAGELARMSEVLDQAFALLGKDIVLAHAKDLDHDGDAGHKAAGEGLLDYPRYLSLLLSSGFRGPLLLHGLSESQVPGCAAFLRKTLATVVAPQSRRTASKPS